MVSISCQACLLSHRLLARRGFGLALTPSPRLFPRHRREQLRKPPEPRVIVDHVSPVSLGLYRRVHGSVNLLRGMLSQLDSWHES